MMLSKFKTFLRAWQPSGRTLALCAVSFAMACMALWGGWFEFYLTSFTLSDANRQLSARHLGLMDLPQTSAKSCYSKLSCHDDIFSEVPPLLHTIQMPVAILGWVEPLIGIAVLAIIASLVPLLFGGCRGIFLLVALLLTLPAAYLIINVASIVEAYNEARFVRNISYFLPSWPACSDQELNNVCYHWAGSDKFTKYVLSPDGTVTWEFKRVEPIYPVLMISSLVLSTLNMVKMRSQLRAKAQLPPSSPPPEP